MKNRFSINLISMTLIMFISEMIFRIINDLPILDLNVVRIFFGCIILSSIISFLVSFIKYKYGKYVILLFGIAVTIYEWLQIGFINFLGVFISLSNASQGGAVKDYVGDFLSSFPFTYYLVFIPVVLYVLYIIIFSRRFNDIKGLKIKDHVLFSLLIILVLWYLTGLPIGLHGVPTL